MLLISRHVKLIQINQLYKKVNNIINVLFIYQVLHPTNKEYFLISNAHGIPD